MRNLSFKICIQLKHEYKVNILIIFLINYLKLCNYFHTFLFIYSNLINQLYGIVYFCTIKIYIS